MHPNPLQFLAHKLSLHAPLSSADIDVILALPHQLRAVEPATYLVREGDPPLQCAVLITGFAFRQKLTGDGQRQIISVHMPGEPLDFQNLFLDVSDHSLQMFTHGEVALVAMDDVRAMFDASPMLRHAILTALLVEASIFREWVLNVGRRDARTRVAHLLCELAVRLGAHKISIGRRFEMPMSIEQLADAVALTPVHVSRTLKALEQDGLVIRKRRSIELPDWQRMRDHADFSQRYLHLMPQPH